MFEELSLQELPMIHSGILRRPSSTRPVIWSIEDNGSRAVVKDFSVNGFLFRNLLGRFLIWREKRAYERLQGIEGIPQFFRSVEGLALVLEEVPGTDLRELKHQGRKPPSAFFDELSRLVKQVHEKGIAHCDLKRATNILMDPGGHPHIIDWGAAIARNEFRGFPLDRIYRRFLLDDAKAVVKQKRRYLPDALSPEEEDIYQKRTPGESLVRSLRDRIRSFLQKIA